MYDAPSEPSDNDNVSILYVSNPKSEADLVEYSSGTQPKGRIQVAEGWVGDNNLHPRS